MSDTPVTDAVKIAHDVNCPVLWTIKAWRRHSNSNTCSLVSIEVDGGSSVGNSFRLVDDTAGDGWQKFDAKDAATALRDIADKLSPDLTRRALEIAANLAAALAVKEIRQPVFETLVKALVHFRKHSRYVLSGCEQRAARLALTHTGDIAHWLQQAREFFEQAEEEAADE